MVYTYWIGDWVGPRAGRKLWHRKESLTPARNRTQIPQSYGLQIPEIREVPKTLP